MAGTISKRALEDIRFRTDIVELIGSYFDLKRSGSTFKALCPFHKEKTPSFHVNPQRQIYHCFGCGAGGDVFAFMMQQEGVPFMTAVKMLAQRAGIQLEIEEGSGETSHKTELYEIHRRVAELYHKALLERESAAGAREFLEKRKISSETIESFFIGYAPDRWDAVLKWAMRKKYSLEQVERSGIIMRKSGKEGGNKGFYDRFRNRIMFPVFDEQGRIIGFSARTLEEKAAGAKYINSPETPLFAKSRILYALDKARRHIVDEREALVCEGQIDVIRCHQAGFETAVAAQGTAFTEDHVRILRRYADSVCIVFDRDKAGQNAAVKTASLCISAGLAVRVAMLPQGEDPDSFILSRGSDAFRKILENAGSAVEFQVKTLGEEQDLSTEI